MNDVESWVNVSQISMDDKGRMNTEEIARIYTTILFTEKKLSGMSDFIPYAEPMMLPLSYGIEEASITSGLIVGSYMATLEKSNPATVFKFTAKVYAHSVKNSGKVDLVETFVQRSDAPELDQD